MGSAQGSPTPMMEQYQRIKEKHPDEILFFRLGDFYEMFGRDAHEASLILGLTLTHRQSEPMCGIPYHASTTYIVKLLRHGKKVAICEQKTLPSAGVLVERDVTQIITPATVLDDEIDSTSAGRYLLALCFEGDVFSVAFAEPSTGELFCGSCPGKNAIFFLRQLLASFSPKEILMPDGFSDPLIEEYLAAFPHILITRFPAWSFSTGTSYAEMLIHFKLPSLHSFGFKEDDKALAPLSVIFTYLRKTLGEDKLPQFVKLSRFTLNSRLVIDDSSLANLEVLENLYESSGSMTLFSTMNFTSTAMGQRLLRESLVRPLIEKDVVESRHAVVGYLLDHADFMQLVHGVLSSCADLARLASKCQLGRLSVRDVVAILVSFEGLARLIREGKEHEEFLFRHLSFRLSSFSGMTDEIVSWLSSALAEGAVSARLSSGGIFAPEYDADLSELWSLEQERQDILASYLEEEKSNSGISSLKLKENKVLGYFLEVSASALKGQVPPHFIKKQDLVGGQRFTTQRLLDLTLALSGAHEKRLDLERHLFEQMCQKLQGYNDFIRMSGALIAHLDLTTSFAQAAKKYSLVCPEMSEESVLEVQKGAHPVLSANMDMGHFIPNSLTLGGASQSFSFVTGPNMAGKSTFLRQNALIVLLAHAGSYVPAEKATIGMTDRIFCRAGASDHLTKGESTFLVEMNETALILNSATGKSFVVMDEVGRGTGTADGLAISQAVCEHMISRLGCRVLFATHFLQLPALFPSSSAANLCMQVKKRGDKIVFLRQVAQGIAASSYGVNVAELAGLPDAVLRRAKALMKEYLEKEEYSNLVVKAREIGQASLFDPAELIREELSALNLADLTPRQAMEYLYRWKNSLK